MSALWSRLKTKRKKAGAAATQEWEKVEKMGQRNGMQERKNDYLALTLTYPDTWESRVV